MHKDLVVVAAEGMQYLAQEVAQQANLPILSIRRKMFFSNEEPHLAISPKEVAGKDVIYISCDAAAELREKSRFDQRLLRDKGARSLTVIISCLPFATQERDVEGDEALTCRYHIESLTCVPACLSGIPNKFIILDAHCEANIALFPSTVVASHWYCEPLILEIIRGLNLDNYMLGCPDAGRAKWIASFAKKLGVGYADASKLRFGDQTEFAGFSGDVRGKIIVMYDDMVRSGSSSSGAADAFLKAGASAVIFIGTHGMFDESTPTKKGYQHYLIDSGVFQKIIVLDTHPRARLIAERHPELIIAHSVAPRIIAGISNGFMR